MMSVLIGGARLYALNRTSLDPGVPASQSRNYHCDPAGRWPAYRLRVPQHRASVLLRQASEARVPFSAPA
jgi:hypothetical protein